MHSTSSLQAPPARGAAGTAREQVQGVQTCLLSVTDGHAKIHAEKLRELTPNENTSVKIMLLPVNYLVFSIPPFIR